MWSLATGDFISGESSASSANGIATDFFAACMSGSGGGDDGGKGSGKGNDSGSKPPIPDLHIDDAQFGKKIGQHAKDFGLDPANPANRELLRNLIDDIAHNYEEVKQGPWRGGVSDYIFFRKGSDVVVTKSDGEFVTILKDGYLNKWFQGAQDIGK